jgi:GINS complex subunit 4
MDFQIDKYTLHYLSDDDLRSRLSQVERSYATRHQALLHQHYLSSFMSSFPPNLQNLNDSTGTVPMIDGPDLDAGVFIRLLKDQVVLGRGTEDDGEVDGKDGDILILRWSDAKMLVDSGTAELV